MQEPMVYGGKTGGKQHGCSDTAEDAEAEDKLVELFLCDSGQLLFPSWRRGGWLYFLTGRNAHKYERRNESNRPGYDKIF